MRYSTMTRDAFDWAADRLEYEEGRVAAGEADAAALAALARSFAREARSLAGLLAEIRSHAEDPSGTRQHILDALKRLGTEQS